MKPSVLEQRIKDLDDNISEDYELLKDVEDALRLSRDPLDKRRFKQDIKEIRKRASRYQIEYESLVTKLTDKSSAEQEQVSSRLDEIDDRLDSLLVGQREIKNAHRAIHAELIKSREILLNHYKDNEREVIASITENFNKNQTTLVRLLLDGIEANQLSDSEMKTMLADLQQHIPSLSGDDAEAVLGIMNSPEASFRHRLKVAVPLIPQLLPFLPAVEYEGEVELGTGFDVKAFWEKVKAKLPGK